MSCQTDKRGVNFTRWCWENEQL